MSLGPPPRRGATTSNPFNYDEFRQFAHHDKQLARLPKTPQPSQPSSSSRAPPPTEVSSDGWGDWTADGHTTDKQVQQELKTIDKEAPVVSGVKPCLIFKKNFLQMTQRQIR